MQNIDASTNKQPHPHHEHTVKITIDGRKIEIAPGSYSVADLKSKLGIPVEYELEIVEDGLFIPLDVAAQISIHGHEEFISHVKCGASS